MLHPGNPAPVKASEVGGTGGCGALLAAGGAGAPASGTAGTAASWAAARCAAVKGSSCEQGEAEVLRASQAEPAGGSGAGGAAGHPGRRRACPVGPQRAPHRRPAAPGCWAARSPWQAAQTRAGGSCLQMGCSCRALISVLGTCAGSEAGAVKGPVNQASGGLLGRGVGGVWHAKSDRHLLQLQGSAAGTALGCPVRRIAHARQPKSPRSGLQHPCSVGIGSAVPAARLHAAARAASALLAAPTLLGASLAARWRRFWTAYQPPRASTSARRPLSPAPRSGSRCGRSRSRPRTASAPASCRGASKTMATVRRGRHSCRRARSA